MFLVVPNPDHGLVAAPESSRDLTPSTTEYLTCQGFAWNDDIEAYTRRTDQSPAAVHRVARVLREMGHYVFCAHRPLPTR
ncbi:hypothetical protein ABTZ58_35845 [Streptomyces sp. NPDC094143]|uniref:hypothetical protein n=1 Tax=Streptomyces sp. NPDC094143 TaxID=3155310 RepID=UPI003319B1CE